MTLRLTTAVAALILAILAVLVAAQASSAEQSTAQGSQTLREQMNIAERNALTEEQNEAEMRAVFSNTSDDRYYAASLNPPPEKIYAKWRTNKGTKIVRWGEKGRYGYRKIKNKHGWLPDLHKATINNNDFYARQGGSTDVYQKITRQTAQYQYLHKVVIQNNKYNDGKMKGIITAYTWKKPKCSRYC